MAIKIKRSTGDLAPAELAAGQLAYAEGPNNGGTLYYGEIGGTVREIAGRKYVDKLNGIEAGAQVNTVDSVNGQTGVVVLAVGDISGAESTANKGVANGYASLDASGLVPSTQLPSYVDDVLEYANLAAFPATGESDKIYVALDTSKIYRWSGSIYVEIVASPGTTDDITEGSTNLFYTDARARAAISVSGDLSYDSGTGVISYTAPASIANVVEDTTPQLGGNLDVNGFQITNASENAYVEVGDNYVLMGSGPGAYEIYGDTGLIDIYSTTVRIQSITYPDADGTAGQMIVTDGAGVLSFTDVPVIPTNISEFTNDSGFIANVVEDTTPELGGDLNVRTHSITSNAGNDIKLDPTTGQVRVVGEQIALESALTDAYITTIGTKDLVFNTNQGANSGRISIFDGADQNIELVPNGTGKVRLGNNYYPMDEASAGQYLRVSSTNGQLEFGALPTIPTNVSDLTNDSGFIANVVEDTTPQLGGDLDVQTYAITTSEVGGSISLNTGVGGRLIINSALSIDSANIYSPDQNSYYYIDNGQIELNSSDGEDTNSAIYLYNTGEVQIDAPNGLTMNGINYPVADGTAGQMLITNGEGDLSFTDVPEVVTTFTGLTDTPAAYTGAGGYFVRVNSGATALEFTQDVDDGTF